MLQGNFRQYGMVVALAVIVILFQVWTSGILLKPLNVTNIVQQNGYILILAIGMVIVIISGHIDLSVGSIAGVRRGDVGGADDQATTCRGRSRWCCACCSAR